MTPLTGKQRRYLRSLANPLKATIHVGHDGVTETVIAAIEGEFDHRELLKITVNQNAPHGAKEIARQLAEAAHAHWVQTIGRTVVLYRQGEEPEIVLPGGDAPQR